MITDWFAFEKFITLSHNEWQPPLAYICSRCICLSASITFARHLQYTICIETSKIRPYARSLWRRSIVHAADCRKATCSNGVPGIQNDNICCENQCGSCGGTGCSQLPGGEVRWCPFPPHVLRVQIMKGYHSNAVRPTCWPRLTPRCQNVASVCPTNACRAHTLVCRIPVALATSKTTAYCAAIRLRRPASSTVGGGSSCRNI